MILLAHLPSVFAPSPWQSLYQSAETYHPVRVAPTGSFLTPPNSLDGALSGDYEGQTVAGISGTQAYLFDAHLRKWRTVELKTTLAKEAPLTKDRPFGEFTVCPDMARGRMLLFFARSRTVVPVDLASGRANKPLFSPKIFSKVPHPKFEAAGGCPIRISPDGRYVALSLPGTKLQGEGPDTVRQTWLVTLASQTIQSLGEGEPVGWTSPTRLLVWRNRGDAGEVKTFGTTGKLVWQIEGPVVAAAAKGVVALGNGNEVSSLKLYDSATGQRSVGRIDLPVSASRSQGSVALVRRG